MRGGGDVEGADVVSGRDAICEGKWVAKEEVGVCVGLFVEGVNL